MTVRPPGGEANHRSQTAARRDALVKGKGTIQTTPEIIALLGLGDPNPAEVPPVLVIDGGLTTSNMAEVGPESQART